MFTESTDQIEAFRQLHLGYSAVLGLSIHQPLSEPGQLNQSITLELARADSSTTVVLAFSNTRDLRLLGLGCHKGATDWSVSGG